MMIVRTFIFILLIASRIVAQDYPSRPLNYITDETATLSDEQQQLLNNKLKKFEDSTSNQIFVFMTNALNGKEMSTYVQEIFHHWKIGQKGKNNGVLIAIFKADHKFRIHTGYGLEGALPDLITKRVQDEIMRPRFREKNYYAGIRDGIFELINYLQNGYNGIAENISGADSLKDKKGLDKANEETNPAVSTVDKDDWELGSWLIIYFFNAILLTVLIYIIKKKSVRNPTTKGLLLAFGIIFFFVPCCGTFIIFILLLIAANWKGSGASSNNTDSISSGFDNSSSDSSSSDSDFGGGGGGDSGGGGSDSSW